MHLTPSRKDAVPAISTEGRLPVLMVLNLQLLGLSDQYACTRLRLGISRPALGQRALVCGDPKRNALREKPTRDKSQCKFHGRASTGQRALAIWAGLLSVRSRRCRGSRVLPKRLSPANAAGSASGQIRIWSFGSSAIIIRPMRSRYARCANSPDDIALEAAFPRFISVFCGSFPDVTFAPTENGVVRARLHGPVTQL